MRKHTDYQLIFHGINSADYFQGCGISLTKFADVATGIGDSNGEALDDALEQLAQGGWDVEELEHDIVTRSLDGAKLRNKPEKLGPDRFYFVSVRVA